MNVSSHDKAVDCLSCIQLSCLQLRAALSCITLYLCIEEHASVWHSIYACLIISLCLLSQPLFASVGQASATIIDSLTWSSFMSLLTHRLVFLWVDACYFIFWDLPGDVLATPKSALYGWIGVIFLSLFLSMSQQSRSE